MTALASRKRVLVAQADHYRESIDFERQQILQGVDSLREFARRNRWWLLAALVGSLLLSRRRRGILSWLPQVFDVWRFLRRNRPTGHED